MTSISTSFPFSLYFRGFSFFKKFHSRLSPLLTIFFLHLHNTRCAHPIIPIIDPCLFCHPGPSALLHFFPFLTKRRRKQFELAKATQSLFILYCNHQGLLKILYHHSKRQENNIIYLISIPLSFVIDNIIIKIKIKTITRAISSNVSRRFLESSRVFISIST